jgi:hypothetical protein
MGKDDQIYVTKISIIINIIFSYTVRLNAQELSRTFLNVQERSRTVQTVPERYPLTIIS